ncbi:MAG: hypothetical protein ACRDTG_26830 [Pseudonocardiaceae bacterium]
MDETKPARKSFDIPKTLIWKAYLKVRDNKGAAGVDGQSLAEFEQDLQNNLFTLEQDVVGKLFPEARAGCSHTEIWRRGTSTRRARYNRPDSADGRSHDSEARGGRGLPS